MIETVAVYSSGTPEHALGSLRLCAPLRAMGVNVHWHRIYDAFTPGQVAESDVVIVQRDYPRHLEGYARVLKAAGEHRKPVIFEIDDLLWELSPDHPDRGTYAYSDALWPMLLAAVQADALSVVSPQLAAYLQGTHPGIYLLPNYFDDGLWQLRPPRLRPDGVTRIGYMGGSSHIPDLRAIVPALLEVLGRYPQVQWAFWGVQPPEGLAAHPQVSWNPLDTQNYPQFAAYFLQQEVDIFIAPLQNNLFNECKSPVKFFECSALGAAGVCSDIAPYRLVVEQGRTGFLAASGVQWVEYLATLIEQPQRRLEMAVNAQAAIRQNWLLSSHAHRWVETYQQVIEAYVPRETSASFDLAARLQGQHLQRLQQMEASFQARLASSEQRATTLQARLDEIEGSRAWKWVKRFWGWRERWRASR